MTNTLVLADPEVAALAWLNDCRAELGLPPLVRLPQGVVASAGRCPLARGLIAGQPEDRWNRVHHPIVSNAWASVSGLDAHRWPMPPMVRQFVAAFDDFKYPHLQATE